MSALLGGKMLNELEDRIVKKAKELEDLIVEMFLSQGAPYGTEPLSGYQLYQQLVAMRATADPVYMNDPAAAATLAKLEEVYGAVPPPSAAPFESNLPPPPPQWQEGY